MTTPDEIADREFQLSVEQIKELPGESTLSHEQQLEFYGLFKQATKGDVTGSRPWNPVGRAKYNAHEACAGMSKRDAKTKYVKLLLDLLSEFSDPKAAEIISRIRPPKEEPTTNVAGGSHDSMVSVDLNASAIPLKGNVDDSFSSDISLAAPSTSNAHENGSTPLSMSTPLKPQVDDADVKSLGAISDQSDTFHDSLGDLNGKEHNKVAREDDDLTTPTPYANGTEEPVSNQPIDQAIDRLQRELNSTTNRVRELEFLLRENPGRARNLGDGGLNMFSGQPAKVAAMILWPVVVHYALSWADRPRSRR